MLFAGDYPKAAQIYLSHCCLAVLWNHSCPWAQGTLGQHRHNLQGVQGLRKMRRRQNVFCALHLQERFPGAMTLVVIHREMIVWRHQPRERRGTRNNS